MTLCEHCIISDIYRFVYYEIPRCATRTMLEYFVRHPNMDYGASRLAPGDVTGGRREYYKFTFVRNPYDRLVSCYQQKINNHRKPGLHIHEKELRYGMPFKDFVSHVTIKKRLGEMDLHYRPQYSFIREDMRIGRLEDFEGDFRRIINEIGLPYYPAPVVNAAPNKKNWQRFYKKDTRALVRKFYDKDFEMLGYE